ncbi:ArsR/SmtB family transcription factor [Denitrobaculum tricleocarpae]|uniref:Helix-turn-helix transcriptional regulator n=1 Tax=Denitrobaculum tricleocarpae TaxID=2591009 RepID=A0A545U2T4_9PROT|nr:metalloregulator ArsR/SmtB family transcription factor [Denitrobaculum tricleocarpae]TQV83792.1 helix-turn-helix transcriptional regulator [Denitrobaculum tricleocarpae]
MAIQYRNPLDHTFHALGDETRRRILSMLATGGPCSANEINAPFDAAQPTISKHLKVLEKAGLVRREVQGRVHRFHLELAPMKEAEDWIARHEAFWQGTLQRLEGYLAEVDGRLEDAAGQQSDRDRRDLTKEREKDSE